MCAKGFRYNKLEMILSDRYSRTHAHTYIQTQTHVPTPFQNRHTQTHTHTQISKENIKHI